MGSSPCRLGVAASLRRSWGDAAIIKAIGIDLGTTNSCIIVMDDK
jgi:hypothetical protein